MTTTPTSAWLPLVKAYCPDVPDPVASGMIRLAVTELCERTKCWRHAVTVDLTEQNQAVVAPDYAAIHQIETAMLDGTELQPTQYTTLATDPEREGAARYITQINPNTVAVIPFQAGTLELTVFLKPLHGEDFHPGGVAQQDNAYDVAPTFMFQTMAEPITHGALARIMNIPGQRFTNPQSAQDYRMRFEAYCQSHFAHAIRGQQRARIRTKYNPF